MTTVHADIGPSALHRLLACPGSHKLSKSRPKGGTSVYAAEGTVAHGIAEDALLNDKDPRASLGDELEADGYTFTVDEEMIEGVELYVDHCRSVGAGATWTRVEQTVNLGGLWSPNDPPEPIFGTADFIAFDTTRNHMTICDFKYGRGDVDPEDNPQAMAYALGAVLTFAVLPREVDIYIVQPRGKENPGVKHWRTTGLDLMTWGTEVLKPGVQKLMEPSAPLVPGTHCKFCPGLAVCPALRKLAGETAREQFAPTPPSPTSLGDEELAQIMDRAEIIKPWLEAVQAEVSARIDRGGSVPGWKLVPKRAVRKWADAKIVERWVEEQMEDVTVFKRALETPTQVEKKDPGLYKRMVDEGLVDATSSGTTLVRDTDPRQALQKLKAKDEFSVF